MATQKIPINIKTSLINIIMSIDELNAKEGEKSHIMIVDDHTNMTIVGCECLSDIIFYSDYFHKFDKPIDPRDIIVMRALIADPTDLPFRLPLSANVFVLQDELGIIKFEFMSEATEHIETMIASCKDMEIEDFAVLIGIELSGIIKARIIAKIEEKRLERTGNLVTKENNSV